MEKVDDHLPVVMARSIALMNDVFVSLLIISVSIPALIIGIIPVVIMYMLIYVS
jgi:hypothetical protein